jgi:general secretion pathway protein E
MQNTQYLEPDNFPKVPFFLETLSTRFIREKKIVPLDLKDNTLKIIMADPDNQEVIDALKVAISNKIEIYTSDIKAIEDYIEKFFTQETNDISKIIENIEDNSLQFIHDDEEDVGHLQDLASEAPIIRLVNMIVSRAVESRASDIHIEPYADELKVRYRIDGVLHDIEKTAGRNFLPY